MKNLFRNKLLFVFLFIGHIVWAQEKDTVFIHEYIYVTDTVWLTPEVERDTVYLDQLHSIENATLIIDSTSKNANLIYFSPLGGATVPIKHILIDDKKVKFRKMKKVNFLTMLFLAFHSLSFAQPDISLKAGLSQLWYPVNPLKTGVLNIGDHEGIEIKGPLIYKNLFISAGFEFHTFNSKIDMDFYDSEGNQIFYDYLILESFRSFPIMFYYRLNRFEVFAGYELQFLKTDISGFNIDGNSYSLFNTRIRHALSAGVEYKITKRLSLLGKLSQCGFFAPRGTGNPDLERTCLDLSLKYYLFRNPLFEYAK